MKAFSQQRFNVKHFSLIVNITSNKTLKNTHPHTPQRQLCGKVWREKMTADKIHTSWQCLTHVR